MQGMGLHEIANAVSGNLLVKRQKRQLGLFDINPSNVSIDTRAIKNNELFIALSGENFDGHDFLEEAYEKGAIGAIVNEEWAKSGAEFPNFPLIMVEDTLLALQELAKYYRDKFSIPIIAITGSNGKTTTKEMIAWILSAKYVVLKSWGNFNNHLGVPLTLLQMEPRHQIAVLEMGMSGFGEIKELCEIANPEIGVITTVSAAHLEFFDNIQEIAMAKGELLQHLSEDGVAILNADNQYVMGLKHLTRASIQTFAIRHVANEKVQNFTPKPEGGYHIKMDDGFGFDLNVIGKHNIYNALAAISVAKLFNVAPPDIAQKISEFRATHMRMEKVAIKDFVVINDAYNANPDSMIAGLETLKDFQAMGKKIAVLGDMLELGENAEEFHYEIGGKFTELGLDILIAVGEFSKNIAKGALEKGSEKKNIFSVNRADEAVGVLKKEVGKGDVILIKGSRGVKMEKIIDELKEEF